MRITNQNMPKVDQEAPARMLAAAIIEDVFEHAPPGREDEDMAKGRALFNEKVVAELHHLFDAVLSEYAT